MAMTNRELLLQELEGTSDDLLQEVVGFLRFLKRHPKPSHALSTYAELLERLDYLEAIVGIRQGLAEYKQGMGLPAAQALEILQQKLNIPPRP